MPKERISADPDFSMQGLRCRRGLAFKYGLGFVAYGSGFWGEVSVPFRLLSSVRVPCYLGDEKRDPHFESHPRM